ncbi:hypothetical protein ABT115_15280 [Streptomyces sp. NPDC001832]|uniref:hypothetical protein n=1 Tax=Streptomyces sp. NPDC001832 TaxID=3154527 RepID=UPI00331DF5AC
MADSEGQAKREAVRARIAFSELVPDGRSMVQVELPEETVFCVRPGEMSKALAAEWNRRFEHTRWLRAETDERPGGHPPI